MGFCNCSFFLLCVTLCPFLFCNHLDREERAGCFALFVFLVSRDFCMALLHGAIGLSAACDCGISSSYSPAIFVPCFRLFIIFVCLICTLVTFDFVNFSMKSR